METEKVDLALSLSLPSFPLLLHRSTTWSNAADEARPRLKSVGLDRTGTAAAGKLAAEEDEEGASSPDSTLSSVRLERTGSRGISDDEIGDAACRKKLRLSKDQSAVLEDCFKEHSTLNPKQKLALAKQLGLRPRQVEVWFQNRRARTKLKQTEVDCEYLKRWCERLAEENRRLQKEVVELRALKVAPPPPPLQLRLTADTAPPATFTMCPSCRTTAVATKTRTSSQPLLPPTTGPFFPVATDRSEQLVWAAPARAAAIDSHLRHQ